MTDPVVLTPTGTPIVLAPEPLPVDPDATTSTTQVTAVSTAMPASPWLTRHLTALITLLLTATVCILALWFRDRDAIVALMGSYGTLIGVLFGSRTALKVPGKDT